MDGDCRMQTTRGLPCSITHSTDISPGAPAGCNGAMYPLHNNRCRNGSNPVTLTSIRSTLESTQRTVPPPPRFFAHHIPWLDRGPQMDSNAVVLDFANRRETKLVMGRKPRVLPTPTRMLQKYQYGLEILPHIMWQHESIVEIVPPSSERLVVILSPKRRDQTSDQQLVVKLIWA